MSFVSIFHQYSYLTPIAIHFERNNGFRKWKNLLFTTRYFHDYDEAKILCEEEIRVKMKAKISYKLRLVNMKNYRKDLLYGV